MQSVSTNSRGFNIISSDSDFEFAVEQRQPESIYLRLRIGALKIQWQLPIDEDVARLFAVSECEPRETLVIDVTSTDTVREALSLISEHTQLSDTSPTSFFDLNGKNEKDLLLNSNLLMFQGKAMAGLR